MISTIITAGGSSVRFGENKLLVKIGDKSVIEHTILKFLDISDEIIIPVNDDTREFLKSCTSFDFAGKITLVKNGATRRQSVYNALLKCKFKDFVLIHDGARPFIEKSDILKIIDELKTKDAICAGKFATDTVKITDNSGVITKTIERKNVFLAQTPQAFKYDLIMDVHKKFAHRDDFTDDSGMVEEFGKKVYCFITSGNNKKITTRADL